MTHTWADKLARDPRLAAVKATLLQLVSEYQRNITRPAPPHDDLRQTYQQMLDQLGEARGGKLFYRYLGSGFGRGALVELADGSIKYDMIGGIGVHGMGHSHPDLLEAGIDAALSDTVMQGNLQQNTESLRIADKFITIARAHGSKLAHCFLTSSGAMANENALKMALQARAPADRILAFEHCFMGRTLTLAQITDKPAYRAGLPTTVAVDYVPFFDPASPAESTARAARVLHSHLARHPGQHAVMCMELIQGEGGYNVGDRDFFLTLIRILKQHNVAVLIDEVQSFGRTTQPFAFSHFGLDEYVDLVTVGKLTQVCATLFTDAYKPKPGLVSQTFTASTSALLACAAILDELTQGDYFGSRGRIMQIHQRFVSRLTAINDRHPGFIAGPFGIGSMIAFTVFDGHPQRTRDILHQLFDAGVVGFLAGANPTRIRFLPPVAAVTDDDIDAVCNILEAVLVAAHDKPHTI